MIETPQTVSEMVRTTVTNSSTFFDKVADHIESLEKTIADLQQKNAELTKLVENDIDDHK